MCLVQPGLVGRSFSDNCLATNQRRFVGLLRGNNCRINSGYIMTVHVTNDIPSISFKTFRSVIREPPLDVSVNRYTVVIIQGDQLVQFPCSCQRTGFMRNPLHQTTISEKDIGIVIDNAESGTIELLCQQFFGQSHTDRIADTLSQRTGCRIDSRSHMNFRMPRSFGMELAELPDIFHRQIVAGQM